MLLLHMLMVLAGLECRYNVTSASMAPSLPVGAVFAARARQPYCRVPITISGPPKPGDLVLFHGHGQNQGYILVKRVVAVAAEHVAISDGRLFINGKMVPRGYLGDEQDTDSVKKTVRVSRYAETLPNGIRHDIFEISDSADLDNIAEQVVPAGGVFVLGDNRDRSADSRVPSFGMVSLKDIVANAGPDAAKAINNGAL